MPKAAVCYWNVGFIHFRLKKNKATFAACGGACLQSQHSGGKRKQTTHLDLPGLYGKTLSQKANKKTTFVKTYSSWKFSPVKGTLKKWLGFQGKFWALSPIILITWISLGQLYWVSPNLFTYEMRLKSPRVVLRSSKYPSAWDSLSICCYCLCWRRDRWVWDWLCFQSWGFSHNEKWFLSVDTNAFCQS
jgi:hypothetical protein